MSAPGHITTPHPRRRRYSAKSDPARPPHVHPDIWRAYGDRYPGSPKRAAEQAAARQMLARGWCAVPGCTRLRRSRGWCPMHYMRWLRTGDPLAFLRPPRPAPPSVEQIRAEMVAALAALHAVVEAEA